jgi:outer membrane protein assembly factor BamE (lipoprotein component of BamABCDE complex)
MRPQHYILAVVGICLAACSPRVRPADRNTDVVFVPLGEETKEHRNAEHVVIGMSRQQVEATMGPSVETCWIYPAGNVRQLVCFRDRKVSAIIRTEELPGRNRALIDATFAGETPTSIAVAPDKLAIGASREQVRRLLGSPQTTREQYDVGTGYRATFENGRLTRFERIPVPPAHGISGTRPGARP